MAIEMQDAIKEKESKILENLMAMESGAAVKQEIKDIAQSPSLLKDYFADEKQVKKAQDIQLATLKAGDISPKLVKESSPVFAKLQSKLEASPAYQEADEMTKVALAQEELKQSKSKTMDTGEIFARSIIALAPALIGYGLGGSLGGVAGAEASKKTLETATELEKSQKEALEKEAERKMKLGLELIKYQKEAQKAAREEGFKQKELQLKERGVIAQEQEALKKASPGATKLPPDKVIAISEFKAIPQLLQDLSTSIELNEQIFGRGAGRAAGAITKLYPLDVVDTLEAQISNVRQTVGKLKEGGVLRAEDEVKYRKMLPELTDSPGVAKNKIKLVLREMNQKYLNTVSALQAAGYDVSPFNAEPIEIPGLPLSEPATAMKLPGQIKEAQAAQRPKRVIQNGVEYILNPATGQYE
jgi:hypothetical protein